MFRKKDQQLLPVLGRGYKPEGDTWLEKASAVANTIFRLNGEFNLDSGFDLAIEEPIYSWGRKNPKGFAKQNLFIGALITILDPKIEKLWTVNPKSMKLAFTGNGKADKDLMIEKAMWFIDKRWAKWGQKPDVPFEWPKRKAAREAIADAIGIGITAWRHHLGHPVSGVELLIK